MKQLLFKPICVLFISFLSLHLSAQSPGGVAKHSIWLQGDFNTENSSVELLNYNPALVFNENTQSLKIDHNLANLGQANIFTVYKTLSPDKEKAVWKINGDFGDLGLSTKNVISNKSNLVFVNSNETARLALLESETIINTYTRSVGKKSSNIDVIEDPTILFGESELQELGTDFSGLIAEFIVYEKILKEKEKSKIESYLAIKYGITLQSDYVNSKGKKVWDKVNESDYSNDIAGIARDDKSSLYQKQSYSGTEPNQLTIAVNNIAEDNSLNQGKLNNLDYLIWGNNGEVFNLEPTENTNDLIYADKKWLIKASGSSANTISTQLSIDLSNVITPELPLEKLYLMIDRSGEGVFDSESTEFIKITEIDESKIARIDDVYWDTDLSGMDVFTFGLKHDSNSDNQIGNQAIAGEISNSFLVYPNPTDGDYQIEVTFSKATDIEVQIFDINQKLIDTKKSVGKLKHNISGSIKGLPAGIYTIKAVSNIG